MMRCWCEKNKKLPEMMKRSNQRITREGLFVCWWSVCVVLWRWRWKVEEEVASGKAALTVLAVFEVIVQAVIKAAVESVMKKPPP
jgi:hypothetical protein